ncbi:signal recognition particle-docking protein FtsY [Myxococcota bacterium]|nr:signal recognition particle-docking protein FtsY [Myxococcota bacterium]MBU1413037.1 signal recognition particle-docking protein FtsY [Myxococcota bacterium]MBU1511693.1 signal recognition particle-docking protein FtsY [Myxococcota bacterium]
MESVFSIVLFSAVLVGFLALIVRFLQVQKRRRRELGAPPEPETRKKKATQSSRPTRSRPARRRMEKEKYEEDEGIEDGEPGELEESEEKPVAAVLVEHEPSPIPVPRPLISADPEPKPAAKAEPKPAAKAEPKPAAKAEPKPAAKAEPEPAPEPAVVVVEKEKTLREGLEKTRGGFISRIGKLFSLKKEIDDDLLGELEEALFTADIGPLTANKLFEAVRVKLSRKQLGDPDVVWKALREMSLEILNVPSQKLDFSRARPFVILVAGVNGVGKTTTIGKLASQYRSQGKRVLLAAADTFRAAAIDQLAVWAERAGCEIVRGTEGADPSSVVFDAVRKAREEDYDIVIADTAGRLHTQVGLMEELGKVRRTAAKAFEGAPHESFLVLDATTGQNALAQADMFMKTLDFTGIVITKLDGTAKGGIILGVCDRMQVPVRYIGIGEKINDLRQFSAEGFVDALFTSES